MTEFTFQILTPERVILRSGIVSLVAPGQDGYFGVMARHAPMLAALTTGEVKITEPSGTELLYAVGGGVLEVAREEVVLLADTAERAEEIDVRRAEARAERAIGRLSRRDGDTDINRAQTALLRALIRLRVASRGSTQT